MSSLDWEEVKRLAADFQKAQLSSTLQKLSERNCVEIITKLIDSGLLEVIFTADGKEYLTASHLVKEIRDELYVHGGRIPIVELTKLLNVDLSHISKAANELEKHDKSIKVILGQIIDKNYMMKIVGEINDKLNQIGFINIAELTLTYDLPADFLQSLVEKALGKTIQAKQDRQDARIFYTEGFIATNKSKMRGAFAAITKPTPLSAIVGQCNVPDRIFFAILDNLQGSIQIPGVITGKQGNNGLYIPTIYSKSQSDWVDNFYKQNGYLEYDALMRLGISDPKGYVRRHFPSDNLTFLDTVAVGAAIIDQVDANIEETIATSSFTDIYPLLPSVFSSEDVETLLKEYQKRSKTNFHIFATTVIVSDAFLQLVGKSLETKAERSAKEAVDSGKWLQYVAESKLKTSRPTDGNKNDKKDERRKKATSGKAGGGSQGRETKTKSTKKKYNPGKNQDYVSDDERTTRNSHKSEFIFVTEDDVKDELNKDENLVEIEGFVEQLTEFLQPKLNKMAHAAAEQMAVATKTNNLTEVEERLNIIMTNIRIFDKGIKYITSKDSQEQLSKYLMKTLGSDFINDILKLAAQQNVVQYPTNLTIESRQKMLLELPKDVMEPLGNLHKAVAKGSVEEFLTFVEPAMASCCLVLRKFDKKREKAVVLGHRQALLEQLNETQDPALVLHLVTSVLFTAATQAALHMSGRHVASVLAFLQGSLESETTAKLARHHDLVLQLLSSNSDEKKEEARQSLDSGLQELKDIANDFKKHISSTEKPRE